MHSYGRYTVVAIEFVSLGKANPCSFSNATNQRMLLFGLDCCYYGFGRCTAAASTTSPSTWELSDTSLPLVLPGWYSILVPKFSHTSSWLRRL